jgi:Nuclear transport factor 2 (NTF2) domain
MMSSVTDKSATMKQYFGCMDSADFVTAAEMFADDAVYLRPPFVPGQAAFAGTGTQKIEGLPAISAFWEQRGKRATHHVIQIESITDTEWFAEGSVSVDDSEERLFLTHVTFNDAGLIKRFVALR